MIDGRRGETLLRNAGLTCYRISKILDAEVLKPRKAAKWAPNTVQTILGRMP